MRSSFGKRAAEMGLDTSLAYKGLYRYVDAYGEVIYRTLAPLTVENDPNGRHETDGEFINLLGVFTKDVQDEQQLEHKYAGYVSDAYKFIGNDVLNQRIRTAIQSVGMPILEENVILWDSLCRMRNEIIIRNGQQIDQVGDVLPVMIVNNSYNGTRAATLAFGIAIANASAARKSIFGFTLGEMRQVHIASSTTQLSSAVSSYMQVFTENINEMITQSFNSTLTETEMLSVLDLIEGIGKNRRNKISEILNNLNPIQTPGSPPPLPSAWQVFLAIARYSSLEPNLNSKRLLENAAESVLVIPPRMFDVLERLQKE